MTLTVESCVSKEKVVHKSKLISTGSHILYFKENKYIIDAMQMFLISFQIQRIALNQILIFWAHASLRVCVYVFIALTPHPTVCVPFEAKPQPV